MSPSCASCGSAVPEGSRFCPQCGSRLTDATSTAVIPPRATLRDRAAVTAERGRGVVDVLRAGLEARRAITRLRAEREQLLARRRELLLALGEAVYGDDAEEISTVRERLEGLDALVSDKEREMELVAGEARQQAARTRFETAPTQVIEPSPQPGEATPPEPARVPEPYPSPGEADPPEPARIPEPYPSPGEADPPEPARVPEPYPPPDEGDPPEPARIPEAGRRDD